MGKDEAFKEEVTKRIVRAKRAIQGVGNLSGPACHATPGQVRMMFGYLREWLDVQERRFVEQKPFCLDDGGTDDGADAHEAAGDADPGQDSNAG